MNQIYVIDTKESRKVSLWTHGTKVYRAVIINSNVFTFLPISLERGKTIGDLFRKEKLRDYREEKLSYYQAFVFQVSKIL